MTAELPIDELAFVFARIRGMLLTEETVGSAVEHLAKAAKTTVPAAIGAGVTVISSSGAQESTGSTDKVVREADDLQYTTGEGPCLSAWAAERPVLVDDVQTDQRWPQWSTAVVSLPIQSVLSVPLVHDQRPIGAMKVYSAFSNAFDDESERLLMLLAQPAAALLAHVQTNDSPIKLSESLHRAIESRDTINIGKGLVMAQHSLTADEATLHMIRRARSCGITLRECADRIIDAEPHATGRVQ